MMLFRRSLNPRPFDMLPDGRLIGLVPVDDSGGTALASREIKVVLNWMEELKQRVPR